MIAVSRDGVHTLSGKARELKDLFVELWRAWLCRTRITVGGIAMALKTREE